MKYDELIKRAGQFTVFTPNLLAQEGVDDKYLKVQLSRWVKVGKLIMLRRGYYLLPEKYRKVQPYEPYIANQLKHPSYLSLEKALEFHHLIPEAVHVYTSVTTKRPCLYKTALGRFDYRHIKTSIFWGYLPVSRDQQTAFIATPEKALLDLIYLNKIQVNSAYVEELRLQNLEQFSTRKLLGFARRFRSAKMMKAAQEIKKFVLRNKGMR